MPADIRKVFIEGISKDFVFYDFYDCHFEHGPGFLQIARKDIFLDDEAALLTFCQRAYYNEYSDTFIPALLTKSSEDDLLLDVEEYLLPIYGTEPLCETEPAQFMTFYKAVIGYMTGYYIFENVDEKTEEYVFNTYGILRNGREYTGDYFLFDPLLNSQVVRSFSIFDAKSYRGRTRKEYFAITARHYLHLGWFTKQWLTPLF